MKKLVVIASTLTLLMGLSVTSAKASPNELSNLNADSELYNAVGWQMAKVTQKQATDVVSFLKTKVLPSTRLTSAQKATLINKAITQLTANEPYHPSRVSSYGVKALSNIATIVSASGVLNALQKQSLMVRSIGKVIYINLNSAVAGNPTSA